MKFATIRYHDIEQATIVEDDYCLPVSMINKFAGTSFPESVWDLVTRGESIASLNAWYRKHAGDGELYQACAVKIREITFGPPYRKPKKIWGIGLNYAAHAQDLAAKQPDSYPAGFNKPPTSIIGHTEPIILTTLAGRTTAEAELGIVLGKKAKNIEESEWMDYVAAFVPVIDVTSLDILIQNPRYLGLSKSFDTFFGFGPVMVTPDEIDNVNDLEVSTVNNGVIVAKNRVSGMRFPPAHLISFLSHVFTWEPGDILSTGTPGATNIVSGDNIEAQITGFPTLQHPVKRV